MKNNVHKITRALEYAAAAVVLLFCEWFFFRNVLADGALIGDRGDGRLTTLLTEHWWNFFCGRERFSEIAMFFPVRNVIGYTDLFLGYGIVHSLFRLFGLDMFTAYKCTLLTVHLLGTVTMYYLMKRKMRCNTLWALFGTMAFCFSDSFARHLSHTQLDAICALPLLLILFVGFIESFELPGKRRVYACAFLVWFALLTYTSWYVACFTGIFCLVFIIVTVIRLKLNREKLVPLLRQYILPIWKELVCYLVLLIILYIPFMRIYIPVMRSTAGYHYTGTYLPEFADLFNVSTRNLMLGKVIELMRYSMREYSAEVEMGFSIILLGLFVFTFIVEQRKNHLSVDRYLGTKHSGLFGLIVPSTVSITVITCIVLMLRLSSHGLSLWIAVYYLLPIVRSMRAISRFMLWLSFPMVVITSWLANRYMGSVKTLRRVILPVLALLLLFVSNIDKEGVDQRWNKYEELDFLSSVSAPPEDAEVFYITDSGEGKDPAYIYQLDACEIANLYSLKTINGYSGQFPEGWKDGIWEVTGEHYEESVLRWIQQYDLSHVYSYDRATNIWTAVR